jgi:hypothetical protein
MSHLVGRQHCPFFQVTPNADCGDGSGIVVVVVVALGSIKSLWCVVSIWPRGVGRRRSRVACLISKTRLSSNHRSPPWMGTPSCRQQTALALLGLCKSLYQLPGAFAPQENGKEKGQEEKVDDGHANMVKLEHYTLLFVPLEQQQQEGYHEEFDDKQCRRHRPGQKGSLTNRWRSKTPSSTPTHSFACSISGVL